MKDREKISVILPVYNMELYIRKCVDSLLDQTYQNLEIILVDDGSPDGSGAICDEYAAKDSRVKVIHKENGGVSSARNAGLDAATGEYIGFVDPDDWVDKNMYAYLVEGLRREEADMATCGILDIRVDGERTVSCGTEQLFSGREVDRDMVEKIMLPSSCNKLTRRELWNGIRFPFIKIGEDQFVTTLIAERAEKIICLPEPQYYYINREGSAIANRSVSRWLDCYDISKAWYDEMVNTMPEREELLVASCVYCAKNIWFIYGNASRQERREAAPRMLEVSRFCGERMPVEIKRSRMGTLGRTVLKLIQYPHRWALWLTWVIAWIFRKTHGGPMELM